MKVKSFDTVYHIRNRGTLILVVECFTTITQSGRFKSEFRDRAYVMGHIGQFNQIKRNPGAYELITTKDRLFEDLTKFNKNIAKKFPGKTPFYKFKARDHRIK